MDADVKDVLARAVDAVGAWQEVWGSYDRHPAMQVDAGRLSEALDAYAERLGGNYPFFHPRYAGQMLKPPHPAAVVGYLAAMLINPNNHALDGGPPTGEMEKDVVRELAAMFHFPDETLGHLTGGGTVANLEALWIARQLHPDRAVAFSEQAHYTHGRMSDVLGLKTRVVPSDAYGRMQPDALEDLLRTGEVGTVVLTAGTTGVGAVDPIAEMVPFRDRYGVRFHVDAAYGGFFTLLAREDDGPLPAPVRRHLRAIAACDSVAIDPHKHGLQPYGCGCILFRDPAVGRFYRHDSPYTYFTSGDLHLGEISLECSRPGAAAGALWFTLRVLPLRAHEGLGPILAACLRAAQQWATLMRESAFVQPYLPPELDILTYLPIRDVRSASALDAASVGLFERAMADRQDPVFLSVLRVDSRHLARHHPGIAADVPQARILRSVLMKPEHEAYVARLHAAVETYASETAGRAA